MMPIKSWSILLVLQVRFTSAADDIDDILLLALTAFTEFLTLKDLFVHFWTADLNL